MARVNVESEVTGKVWKIETQVGDAVDEGEVLMILESMKMEIPIESPATGTITELLVEIDDTVEEDQLIAIVDS